MKCDWNNCIFYAKHRGTCRDEFGNYVNGPRATVERCPCLNCSPLESNDPLQLLWERLYTLFKHNPSLEMTTDVAKELKLATEVYLYRNVHQSNDGLESIDNFCERISVCLTNGEFATELLVRENKLKSLK